MRFEATPHRNVFEKKENLDDILNMLLPARAVKFEIDSGNVYHIKMNLTPLGR